MRPNNELSAVGSASAPDARATDKENPQQEVREALLRHRQPLPRARMHCSLSNLTVLDSQNRAWVSHLWNCGHATKH